MKDFINKLQQNMLLKLSSTGTDTQNVQMLTQKITIVSETIAELKTFIISYSFAGKEEEVLFFKFYEPMFYSQLLYFKQLLELEINCPISWEEVKIYYERELQRVSFYLEREKHWVIYYRTKATYLDEKYFLRNGILNDPISSDHAFTTDTRFCTIGSINFSRIQSCELFIKELERRLSLLSKTKYLFTEEDLHVKKQKRLKWKGPKIGLFEFGRACKEIGALEEPLQEIFECFEETFSIELDNHSRAMQEIASRKKEEVVYLGKLTQALKDLIDRMNKNYKPRK
jgi:RteC protein.